MSEDDAELGRVTRLLEELRHGERGAWDPLLLEVQSLLRGMAHRKLEGERGGHLLQTTALVNETWMRLAELRVPPGSRTDFLNAASGAMRRILVDQARARNARKRGDGAAPLRASQVVLPERPDADSADQVDLEALDLALQRMASDERHARKCRIVELRFFVGLTLEEVAQHVDLSLATVKRYWEFARAWLLREMDRTQRT